MPGIKRKNNNMPHRTHTRGGILVTATALVLLVPLATAWADGQIKFKVVDAKTGAPLPGAVIVIKAGPTDLDDLQFKTGSDGLIATGDLASGTREYTAKALVNRIGYKEVKGKIAIVDEQTIEVQIKLEPQGEVVKYIIGKQLRLDITDPSVYTFRDREHLEFFPNGIGNQQSLTKALRSVPGMVPDSLNRLHSRGESETGTYYIDGFQLPSLLAGTATQFLTPAMLETMKVHTGNLGASLGGGKYRSGDNTSPGYQCGRQSLGPFHGVLSSRRGLRW